MHYHIVMPPNPGAAKVLREILGWLKEEQTMQADLKKLTKTSCAPEKFVSLQGAPLSAPIRTARTY
jgi:ArsR family transcriptional regulator